MKYIVATPKCGWVLHPENAWDVKDKAFHFRVSGKSDSTFKSCPDMHRSTSGGIVCLEGAPVVCLSQGQKFVSLSVTEVEVYSAVLVAQYILYVINFLVYRELQVEKPMVLEIDNKGCIDLINNWSVAGCTRHIYCRK